jgi:hypothetical protein
MAFVNPTIQSTLTRTSKTIDPVGLPTVFVETSMSAEISPTAFCTINLDHGDNFRTSSIRPTIPMNTAGINTELASEKVAREKLETREAQ